MVSTWILAHDQPRKLNPKTDHSACLVTGRLGGLGLLVCETASGCRARRFGLLVAESQEREHAKRFRASKLLECGCLCEILTSRMVPRFRGLFEIRDSGDPLTTIIVRGRS